MSDNLYQDTADIGVAFGNDGTNKVWTFNEESGPQTLWNAFQSFDTNNDDIQNIINNLESIVTAINSMGAGLGGALAAMQSEVTSGTNLANLYAYIATHHDMLLRVYKEFQDRNQYITTTIGNIETKLGAYTSEPREYTGFEADEIVMSTPPA
mgnify:CR=1 FL=1